jgi:hypothetical protein
LTTNYCYNYYYENNDFNCRDSESHEDS